jgi:DNA-binding MarR family transcriptional regulator
MVRFGAIYCLSDTDLSGPRISFGSSALRKFNGKVITFMRQPTTITKADYVQLFSCRLVLRRFLRTGGKVAHHLGLTSQQHELLLAIKGQPERDWQSMDEIAESLGIQHNSAVELVNRCEQMGLVRRAPDLTNRRRVQVSLTESGEARLGRLAEWHRRELELLHEALHERAVELFNRYEADSVVYPPPS